MSEVTDFWEAAIKAIQQEDHQWISEKREAFSNFFRHQNERPRGKLSKEALAAHYRNRLFKMFLSKSMDGLELPLSMGSKWIEAASALESNWGWLLAIGTGGAYFADYMPAQTAEKHFLPREALVAGSGKPDGKAERTATDSWQVSGNWKYCSGSEQASLFTAVTVREGRNIAVILPVDQTEVIRDWNTVGLPLTCSHTIKANSVEVPSDHFFDLSQEPRSSRYPIATYPFLLFAKACFIPVVVGISRAFWEHAGDLMSQKEDVWERFQPERLTYLRQKQEEFLKGMTAMREAFYSSLEKSWNDHLAGKRNPEEAVSETGLRLVDFCFDYCLDAFSKLGMQVLDQDHAIFRKWQDLQTVRQHHVFQSYTGV